MEELSEFLSRGGMADTSTVLEADATSPKQQQQPAVTQPDTKDKDVSIPEFKNSSTYIRPLSHCIQTSKNGLVKLDTKGAGIWATLMLYGTFKGL